MNRQQKIALWVFVAITVALALSVTAFVVLYSRAGLPRAFAAWGFMGVAGLGGLGPIIFRRGAGGVTFDERDRQIQRRSALAGFAAAYVFVGLTCMTPLFVLGPGGRVSVSWLPQIFIGAAISHFFVWSIAVLIQYGWRGEDEPR